MGPFDLRANPTWSTDRPWEARASVRSPLWSHPVEVHVLAEQEGRVTDRTAVIVRDFLSLRPEDRADIQRELWRSCRECCELIDFGAAARPGQTLAEANHDHLGVRSEEDALQESTLRYLLIDEGDQKFAGNYGQLVFDNEWNSDLTVVVMKNGRIVGHGDSGLYVGRYE